MDDFPLPHRPVLAPRMTFHDEPDGLLLDASLRRCKLPAALAEAFHRMQPLLDGRHTLGQVQDALADEYDGDDIAGLVRQLYRDNFLREGDESREALSGVEFYAQLRDWIVEVALVGIDATPYSKELQAGRWTRRLFSGFALELFHFFTNVFEHASAATSAATDPAIRRIFEQFLFEEHAHPKMMAACAESLGIPRAAVYGSRPLPSTQARMSHLTQLAQTNLLAYTAVVAFIESTGGNATAGQEHGTDRDPFIAMLRRNYELPEIYIDNLLKHRIENVTGNHSEVGAAVFQHVPLVDRATQRRVIADVARAMEVELQYSVGLYSYYSDEGNPIPYGLSTA
jgi:hypothetical protein